MKPKVIEMKKSDIGVVSMMYIICAAFFCMTLQLKKEAQIYPMFIICILFLLTTLYLIKMVLQHKKDGIVNDFKEIFKGFLKNQFYAVLALSVVYLALIYFIGFYPSSLIYLVVTLYVLKVPKKHILITTAAMALMVYCAFSLFLNVPLPMGLLFS